MAGYFQCKHCCLVIENIEIVTFSKFVLYLDTNSGIPLLIFFQLTDTTTPFTSWFCDRILFCVDSEWICKVSKYETSLGCYFSTFIINAKRAFSPVSLWNSPVGVWMSEPVTGILLSRAFPHSAHWWGFHWTIEVCLVNSKPSVGEPCLMMPSGWNADVFLKLRLTIWQTLRNTLIKTINEYNTKNYVPTDFM